MTAFKLYTELAVQMTAPDCQMVTHTQIYLLLSAVRLLLADFVAEVGDRGYAFLAQFRNQGVGIFAPQMEVHQGDVGPWPAIITSLASAVVAAGSAGPFRFDNPPKKLLNANVRP
jgi:hypothetical protein